MTTECFRLSYSWKVWFQTTGWRFLPLTKTNDMSWYKNSPKSPTFSLSKQEQNVSEFHTLEKKGVWFHTTGWRVLSLIKNKSHELLYNSPESLRSICQTQQSNVSGFHTLKTKKQKNKTKKGRFQTSGCRFLSFMNTNDIRMWCLDTVQNPPRSLCHTQWHHHFPGLHTLKKSLISDYWLKISIIHEYKWHENVMTWNSPQSPTPPFLSHTMTVEFSGLQSLKISDFELLSEDPCGSYNRHETVTTWNSLAQWQSDFAGIYTLEKSLISDHLLWFLPFTGFMTQFSAPGAAGKVTHNSNNIIFKQCYKSMLQYDIRIKACSSKQYLESSTKRLTQVWNTHMYTWAHKQNKKQKEEINCL